MRYFTIVILLFLITACNHRPDDPNDKGLVERLPKGKYVIWNYGSRHIVKCLREDGTYYWLNDADFDKNGISGYDAHQYTDKTNIVIE